MKIVVATGRRKEAIARAFARKGGGRVWVNRIPLEIYQPELARLKILEPVRLAGKRAESLDIAVIVRGGGVMGQADAARTAVAKALIDYSGDQGLQALFKEHDRTLLVSDVRRKLPKKPLGRGARKKRQKSYR